MLQIKNQQTKIQRKFVLPSVRVLAFCILFGFRFSGERNRKKKGKGRGKDTWRDGRIGDKRLVLTRKRVLFFLTYLAEALNSIKDGLALIFLKRLQGLN